MRLHYSHRHHSQRIPNETNFFANYIRSVRFPFTRFLWLPGNTLVNWWIFDKPIISADKLAWKKTETCPLLKPLASFKIKLPILFAFFTSGCYRTLAIQEKWCTCCRKQRFFGKINKSLSQITDLCLKLKIPLLM